MNEANEKAQIISSQLIKARESIGLSLKDAAGRLNVDEGTLGRWERGETCPGSEELYDIAVEYRRPLAYFFEESVDEQVPLDLREGSGITSGAVSSTIGEAFRQFEVYCQSQWELEEVLGETTTINIDTATVDDELESLAERVRKRVEYAAGRRNDLSRLRQTLNKHGVKVFGLSISEDIDGAAWWHTKYGPAILLNLRGSPKRRLFTLAHEYGHLILLAEQKSRTGVLCNLSDENKVERFCNRFAAGFLVPRDEFMMYLRDEGLVQHDFYDLDLLWRVASHFKVSRHLIAIRLEETGIAGQGFYQSLKQQLGELAPVYRRTKKEWKRKKDDVLGNYYTRLAVQAYKSGRLTSVSLARHMDMRIHQVEELLESTSQQNNRAEG